MENLQTLGSTNLQSSFIEKHHELRSQDNNDFFSDKIYQK